MDIRAVLFDIDGTLFTGSEPIPGAIETIRHMQNFRIPYLYLSNGTRRSRKSVLQKLAGLGLPVYEEQIITPAIAAIRLLIKRGIDRCSLLTTEDLAQDFRSAGIMITDDASVLVVGDAGESFTYAAMNHASRQLHAGFELIALEKDRYWMDTDGLSLGAGAFVSALEYATGVTAMVIGKPSPAFFGMAIECVGSTPEQTLMVGDDIITDIAGAQAAGLYGALVMTGKFCKAALDESGIRPDILISSVADLTVSLSWPEFSPP